MSGFHQIAEEIDQAELLADRFLEYHFRETPIIFPINPFQILKDEEIQFVFRDFKKLEGVFIPKTNDDDLHFVGININRPITRQRFTAAHELCHYLKNAKSVACLQSSQNKEEKFADKFASALLMPKTEIMKKVKDKLKSRYLNFDDVLEIAHYFGVSFKACVYRVSNLCDVIENRDDKNKFDQNIKKYKPEIRRKAMGLSNLSIYEDLMSAYASILKFKPNDFALNVFRNEYIYNDSRLEGVKVSQEEAAEIVADIRMNMMNSVYTDEKSEAFLSIAGHAKMYEYIFSKKSDSSFEVNDLIELHRRLYSYFPFPEYGGTLRDSNAIVTNSIVEPIPPFKIKEELIIAFDRINHRDLSTLRSEINQVVSYASADHHKLTCIHPFGDGNGRAIRAFLNLYLMANSWSPFYVKVSDRDDYLEALKKADRFNDLGELREVILKLILRTSMELTQVYM